MKYLKTITYLFIYLFIYLSICIAFGQSNKKKSGTTQITAFYDALRHNIVSIDTLEKLTPNLKLHTSGQVLEKNNRYTITIDMIIQNQWTQVEVSNLKIKTTKDNFILVTGELSARQPTECEYISTQFHHVWEIKK